MLSGGAVKLMTHSRGVLILVLMEYALWHQRTRRNLIQRCLNPCSNGICSLAGELDNPSVNPQQGLNPCSNGICSLAKMSELVKKINPES